MEIDEEAAGVTRSGARATAPCPKTGDPFCAGGGVPERQNRVRSPNVEDAPSEHSGVEGRLPQLEWQNKILVDSKQTMLKHAEHIPKLEQIMRAM